MWQAIAHKGVLSAAGLIAIFVALVAWAVASPPGSSPDEDYHLASIWCGQGLREGACGVGDSPSTRAVPKSLLDSPCFARDPNASGECQYQVLSHDAGKMAVSSRGNFTGDYPPVFYWVLSHFVGPHIPRSVLVMRIVSALIGVLLVGAVTLVARPVVGRALTTGLLVSVVPTGAFLIASVNPSGWAVIGVPTLAVATYAFLRTRGARRGLLAGLAALALTMAAGSRADAAAYSVVALAAAVVLAFPWPKPRLALLYPAALAGVAGWVFLSAGQSAAVDGTQGVPPIRTLSGLLDITLNVPSLWLGNFGTWGLGWFDTPMPALVPALAWAAFGAVVVLATRRVGAQQALAAAGVFVATTVVAVYFQSLSGAPVGAYIQPRYLLPMVALLVVVLLLGRGDTAPLLSRSQAVLVAVGLGLANSAALYVNIHRYVTGLHSGIVNLNDHVEWWWSLGPFSPMVVWLLGSLAFLAAAVLCLEGMRGSRAGAVVDDVAEHDDVVHERVAGAAVVSGGTAGAATAGRLGPLLRPEVSDTPLH